MSLFIFAAFAIGGAKELIDLVGLNNLLSTTLLSSGDRPQVSLRFNSDGTIDEALGDTSAALTYSETGTWLAGGGAPDDASEWEVSMTIATEDVTSANTFTGGLAAEAFNDLDTNPLVTLTKDSGAAGNSGATVTFTVRNKAQPSNTETSGTLSFDVNIIDDS